METGLSDSVVLVTGGAGGIGESICRAFASEGAKVIVHYHESSENADKIANEIDGFSIKADLRDSNQALALIDTIVENFGKLDICIANAGYYPSESKPIWDIDEERWNQTISSNLDVAVNTARIKDGANPDPAVLEEPVASPEVSATVSGGLAAAIARAKEIKQEKLKSTKQQTQSKSGVNRL